MREGGLEMGEDLGSRRPTRGSARHRWHGWATCQQRGADGRLAPVEPLPDALPASLATRVIDGPSGGGDAAGHGVLEELPQHAAGQTQMPDLVGNPDAEGPTAARPPMAVAAKDPPSSNRSTRTSAVVKAVQEAMANERPDPLAMRARDQLEPLAKRAQLLLAVKEPSLVAHVRRKPLRNFLKVAWPKRAREGGVR
jgi:hypothetical protein